MGCSYGKASAIKELNEVIKNLSKENKDLEQNIENEIQSIKKKKANILTFKP